MDRRALHEIVEARGPDAVVEALRPYLTEARRARIEGILGSRLAGIHVAIEAPSDPHNAAAVVRTAEALGVLDVHVVAAEGNALRARGTTQGAFHWVRTHHHRDLPSLVAATDEAGVERWGAWMEAPTPLEAVPVDRPLCLLLGNESRGLSPEARQACVGGFRIPMFGMSESLNLSVAAAIALYETTRRHRAALGADGDLGPHQQDMLRALHYAASVDLRLVQGLLGEPGKERSA